MMFGCLEQLVSVRLRLHRKSIISRYKRQLTTKLPVSGLSNPYRYTVDIHLPSCTFCPTHGETNTKIQFSTGSEGFIFTGESYIQAVIFLLLLLFFAYPMGSWLVTFLFDKRRAINVMEQTLFFTRYSIFTTG